MKTGFDVRWTVDSGQWTPFSCEAASRAGCKNQNFFGLGEASSGDGFLNFGPREGRMDGRCDGCDGCDIRAPRDASSGSRLGFLSLYEYLR
jgi:hypothetical protein